MIHAPKRPVNPKLTDQPTLEPREFREKPNVMYGQYDLRTFLSPFWPGQCCEVNVAGDVQDVRLNFACFADDVQSLGEAFTELRHFDPRGFLLTGPSPSDLSK